MCADVTEEREVTFLVSVSRRGGGTFSQGEAFLSLSPLPMILFFAGFQPYLSVFLPPSALISVQSARELSGCPQCLLNRGRHSAAVVPFHGVLE